MERSLKKKKTRGLKWYTIDQNNSGGSFDTEFGMSIVIQAHSPDEANDIAEDLGVYFNGVEYGRDCPCCGSRWYRTSGHDSSDVPSLYGTPIEKCDVKNAYFDAEWKDGKAIQIIPHGKPPFFVERGKPFKL